MKNTFELIYDVVRRIPYGKVATYGQIAMLAGNPRWSRVVGYALHVNPDPDTSMSVHNGFMLWTLIHFIQFLPLWIR